MGAAAGGRRFALLAAAQLSLAPALAHLRVDYTLDLALAACTTLALALLGRWQMASSQGGGAGVRRLQQRWRSRRRCW